MITFLVNFVCKWIFKLGYKNSSWHADQILYTIFEGQKLQNGISSFKLLSTSANLPHWLFLVGHFIDKSTDMI